MSKKVLVTGGCGYIGSHTIVDLLNHDFEVISIDNFVRSEPWIIDRIETITGTRIKNYDLDICDYAALKKVFESEPDIMGIIHFAAYKNVGESTKDPLLYYQNNLGSLTNILKAVEEFEISNLVFSSSCTVYGAQEKLPVTEENPIHQPESPYGNTKKVGEEIIQELYQNLKSSNAILLRYFNPIGAHETALIGEVPDGTPQTLMPYLTMTASGKLEQLQVFGSDYDTRDGSCIRDYIHVMDVAHAHTLAFQYLMKGQNQSNVEVFNLGTGEGVTVLEVIKAFETATGISLNYKIVDRRPGDVPAIYADKSKAEQTLKWTPARDLNEMVKSHWAWEQKREVQA